MSIAPEIQKMRDSVISDRFAKDGPFAIAADLGMHWSNVYRRAKRLGLVCVGHKNRARNTTSYCKTCFTVWSPDMAYVLGFIYADGCVGKRHLSIDVTRTDESVLLFIKDWMKAVKPIKRYWYGGETKPYSRLNISSQILVESLAVLGVVPRKTFIDVPFPNVPAECLPHFIRGYFDGDGHVFCRKHQCRIGFIGTPKFIQGIHNALVDLGMSQRKLIIDSGKEASWATVHWTNRFDVRLFHDYIYPTTGYGFCLERKRKPMREWLAIPRNPRRAPSKHRRYVCTWNF